MGLFFQTEKPKFNLIDFLNDHPWEVGFAVGLLVLLALILCRCLYSAKKVPRTPSMEELILPPNEVEPEIPDFEEIIMTPRRSARLRNKRVSIVEIL